MGRTVPDPGWDNVFLSLQVISLQNGSYSIAGYTVVELQFTITHYSRGIVCESLEHTGSSRPNSIVMLWLCSNFLIHQFDTSAACSIDLENGEVTRNKFPIARRFQSLVIWLATTPNFILKDTYELWGIQRSLIMEPSSRRSRFSACLTSVCSDTGLLLGSFQLPVCYKLERCPAEPSKAL